MNGDVRLNIRCEHRGPYTHLKGLWGTVARKFANIGTRVPQRTSRLKVHRIAAPNIPPRVPQTPTVPVPHGDVHRRCSALCARPRVKPMTESTHGED